VIFDMRLGCFPSVVRCVFMVTAGYVRVMRRCLMSPCFVVLRRFPVMSCRVLMMFCCLVMMLCRLL